MRYAPALLAGLAAIGTAQAQDVTVKPSADVRLRYEHADQGGLAREADALTLRVRPGVTLTSGEWSVLVEGEGTLPLVEKYNDGTNGKVAYPLVLDPENVELNRAQIRYASKDGLAFTAGRQRIELADQRFVGSAGWRQNEQTYDAVRVQIGKPMGLSADITYAWNDLTVNGRNGTGARQRAVRGDNIFALLGYGTKAGTLTGFAYLVDQDEAAVQGFRMSSQTWGVRFAGAQPIGKGVKLGYVASWARQSDYHRNPNRFSANYWLGELSVAAKGFTGTAGYEVLGADKGVALTSVQTPLASYFRFNGWVGKFGTTPPNGLHDLYGGATYGWKKVLGVDAVTLSATYHRFDSDRLGQHYGDEIDLLASVKRGRATVSARYAHYKAGTFATDTDKAWLQLDWSL
ncbi:MAG: alginate export family protein [Sphingomonas sp.]|uniref:alginate export family protein n=1 Tax=Sphingomonas sp. TaxID=28214 RepID=UPI0025D0F9EE|nr:alginate export family protein [Sphingomonas sp.]MBX3564271.1 alginate export family protein [Sphingomonas sp.]